MRKLALRSGVAAARQRQRHTSIQTPRIATSFTYLMPVLALLGVALLHESLPVQLLRVRRRGRRTWCW